MAICVCIAGCQSDFGIDPFGAELQNYTIMFARNDTELNAAGGTGRSIYTSRGDGLELRDLSMHPVGGYFNGVRGYDASPTYSHNGRFIAFRTNRDGNEDIYRMDPDGGNKVDLTHYAGLDLEFEWSPDDSRIVFARIVNGNYVVCIVNNDGSGLTQLTDSTLNARYPSWSPDMSSIAYSRFVDLGTNSFWQVVVRNLMSQAAVIISDSGETAVFPQWSRDSKRVYYGIPGLGMKVKALDGSLSKMLPGFFPYYLSWSPDGKEFLCEDSLGIAVANDGLTSVRRLNVSGFNPRWSPDGKLVVFLLTNEKLVNVVYVVKSDGSVARRVTDSRFGDLSPSWRP